MTALSFTQATDGTYVAEITSISATINVDIEREKKGLIKVERKAHDATRYKNSQFVPDSIESADINFNIAQDASSASVDYKITSKTSVTKAYYG